MVSIETFYICYLVLSCDISVEIRIIVIAFLLSIYFASCARIALSMKQIVSLCYLIDRYVEDCSSNLFLFMKVMC